MLYLNHFETLVEAVSSYIHTVAVLICSQSCLLFVIFNAPVFFVSPSPPTGGHRGEERELTESDWSDVKQCSPYEKSKTLAEKAAWDFVEALVGKSFELCWHNE